MKQSLKYATSRQSMVVSGHDLATQSAIDVLNLGGSLVDAAITGASVLSVALPNACGLGGDAFMLVHNGESGETLGLNASGMSPTLANPELFQNGIPERGPLSCNVPGMVAGWQTLHDRFGSLSWDDLLKPAINFARNGIEVSSVLAQSTVLHQNMLLSDSASSRLFLSEGNPLQAGETLTQHQLANTLELIAREGGQCFYTGEIAKSVAHASKVAGGLLRPADFSAYTAEWVQPIEIAFGGHQIRTMPPNSYGLYLLLQLMVLESNKDKKGNGLQIASRFTKLIQAAQAAFAVGERGVADPHPQYQADSINYLLSPDGLKLMQQATPGKPPNLGGTAVITIADNKGNAVTIIQSVFLVFGSGISDEETGVILNNRLFGFTPEQNHPNSLAPHKRPAHTLCPAMVFQDGHLRYALSTPGGPGQTLTLAQVIQALIEEKVSLEEAIQTPRWTMDLTGAALFEDSMPKSVVNDLEELGIPIKPAEPGSPYFGSVKGIELNLEGTLIGVADCRRDASARGLP